MIVNDDPYNRSLIDPLYQNLGYGSPQNQGTDVIGTGGTGGGEGHGGVPIIPFVVGAWHLLSKLFHKPKPTTTLPPPTPTAPAAPEPPATTPPATTPPANTGSSIPKELLGAAPAIIALWQLLSQKNDPTANNPAQSALNSAVPQLTQQLNQLLQNDLQRRQQSDPLYQAVLRGAMGGLPVWMRDGGTGMTGLGAPRTGGSGVPSPPGTDTFRPQGGDPEGYAYPNTLPRV